MPTLIALDGYAHQTLQAPQSSSGFSGIDNASNVGAWSFDTTNKRTASHICSLKMVQDGVTNTNLPYAIAAGNRLLVGSIYVRVAAAPSVASTFILGVGPTTNPTFRVNTNGTIGALISGGTAQATAGSIADSLWHLLDYRIDVSGTTFTIDWAVDGVAQTQASRTGQTAADITQHRLGSATPTHTLTMWFQDFVLSATSGDYAIGAHHVLPLYPNGMGTSTLGTTNAIVDEAAAQANLHTKVDDWNGGTPSTTDYVTYSSLTLGDAASNFVEFTMTDPDAADTTIWDVAGYLAGFANGTGADTADLQILTAHGGTLIDHIGNLIDYSGSTTVLGYHVNQKLARPAGGWTNANLAAAVAQWGRSTDTNNIPRLSAFMLEYAAPDVSVVNATATPTVIAAVAATPTAAITAAANATPSTVASISAVATPTVKANANATPSVIACVAAVPTPAVMTTAAATPTVLAALVALPAPVTTADARAPPGHIAALAAVASPTIVLGTAATPAVLTVVAALPAPTINLVAAAMPATVATVAAVPTPSAKANANATLSVIASVGAVPTPTVTAGAGATPSVVAAIASLPAPSPVGLAVATPTTVAAVASVATPAARANANATVAVAATVAAVPTPDIEIVGTPIFALPARIATVAALATPTITATAVAAPSRIAAAAALPTTHPVATANATPGVVAGEAELPVAIPVQNSFVFPTVIAAVTAIFTPVVVADANATPNVVPVVAALPPAKAVQVWPSWEVSSGIEWDAETGDAWPGSEGAEWSEPVAASDEWPEPAVAGSEWEL